MVKILGLTKRTVPVISLSAILILSHKDDREFKETIESKILGRLFKESMVFTKPIHGVSAVFTYQVTKL